MSLEQEPSPEFLFDTSSGSLLTGEDAINYHIEAGGHPDDVQPLSELLLISDDLFPIDRKQFPKIDANNLEPIDFVSLTKWLGHQVIPHDARFSQTVFDRAYVLGIGPSVRKLDRAGGISTLYDKADIRNVYKRGIYDSWTRQDIAQYVGGIARKTPKTMSLRDRIDQMARDGQGPSHKVIVKRTGSMGNALILDGLVEPNVMNRDDYVEWGVKFYLANNGLHVDSDSLDYMSPLRLSPSKGTIISNFGSIEAFRMEVVPPYQIEAKKREEQDRVKFGEIMQALNIGTLPVEVLKNATCFKEMSQAYAQFMVTQYLLPDAKPSWQISRGHVVSQKVFVDSLIRGGNGDITAAGIEIAAENIGVFDDIWPFDEFMQTLRLPEDKRQSLRRIAVRRS